MPDRESGSPAVPRRPRRLRVALTAGRWLLGAALGLGALSFLLHGRPVFARLGQPDAARIALAGAELAGAALFLFRRTALAGGVVLLIVLAWAAGFHFALDMGSLRLWLSLAAVLVLAAATRADVNRRAA